jgi:hypothetical protein
VNFDFLTNDTELADVLSSADTHALKEAEKYSQEVEVRALKEAEKYSQDIALSSRLPGATHSTLSSRAVEADTLHLRQTRLAEADDSEETYAGQISIKICAFTHL